MSFYLLQSIIIFIFFTLNSILIMFFVFWKRTMIDIVIDKDDLSVKIFDLKTSNFSPIRHSCICLSYYVVYSIHFSWWTISIHSFSTTTTISTITSRSLKSLNKLLFRVSFLPTITCDYFYHIFQDHIPE